LPLNRQTSAAFLKQHKRPQQQMTITMNADFHPLQNWERSINYSRPYFTAYQAVGINVNHHFFVGQGIGLQVADNRLLQIQATADFRAYVLDRNVTPIFVVQAGLNKVSKAPENEGIQLNDSQFMLNAGTGILWQAKPNAAFTINGGYTLCTDFKASTHGGFVKVGYVF
jgi:hypothetical protein